MVVPIEPAVKPVGERPQHLRGLPEARVRGQLLLSELGACGPRVLESVVVIATPVPGVSPSESATATSVPTLFLRPATVTAWPLCVRAARIRRPPSVSEMMVIRVAPVMGGPPISCRWSCCVSVSS